MRNILRLVSIAACILISNPAWVKGRQKMESNNGPAEFNSIDRYIGLEIKRLKIPGLALAIIKGDHVIHMEGFGEVDLAGRPITPQTPFYIASLTKSFTALAVMQLVDAGKINLDNPVKKYLPWFELADKQVSASITVRQLLNQQTGISEFEGHRYWGESRSLEETIRGLGNMQLAHSVGDKYEYSNINYGIAGLVVEKVSGEKFDNYIRQHIFEPLDMRHSYTSREPALADGVAQGHHYMFGQIFATTGSMPPVYLPSSFVISSVEDMAHFLIAQMNEGKYGDFSVVSPAGMKTMHTGVGKIGNRPLHYAMGWAVGSFENEPLIMHNGDLGYVHATALMLPESEVGVLVLTNSSGFEQLSQVDDLSRNVLRLLKGGVPIEVSLPLGLRIIYWTILLLPLLLIGGIVYSMMHGYSGLSLASWQVWMVVLIYLVVAGLSLFKLPGLIPFPLSSMRQWYPELAYALIVNGILGIGWSVIYVVLKLMQSK